MRDSRLEDRRLDGGGHLASGVGGIDHRIDEPAVGRDVRVEEPLLVVGLQLEPLLGGLAAVEDLHRHLGPITAISAEGQARYRSLPIVRQSITMYAAVGLAQRDCDRGTVARA